MFVTHVTHVFDCIVKIAFEQTSSAGQAEKANAFNKLQRMFRHANMVPEEGGFVHAFCSLGYGFFQWHCDALCAALCWADSVFVLGSILNWSGEEEEEDAEQKNACLLLPSVA